MSRELNGTSQYMRHTGTQIVAGGQFTVCGWFYGPQQSAFKNVFVLGGSGFTPKVSILVTGVSPARVYCGYTGGYAAYPSTTCTINNWHHYAFWHDGSDFINCCVDGDWANRNTDGIAATIGALQDLTMGEDGGGGDFFQGLLAHPAVWNTLLTQAQIEGLAGPFSGGVQSGSGNNPQAVQAGNLVAYWPLVGTASPEPDIIGGFDLTLFNSPTQGASDPVVDSYGATVLLGQCCL